MAYRCTWCNNEMDPEQGTKQGSRTIVRSICTTCLEHFVFQMGVPLQTFLDSLPAPIFVVNNDVVVQAANKEGYALLNKDSQQVLKGLGGIVFDCAYAQLPEGCGRTVHCSGCAIRRSVYHTYTTGESLIEVPATLHSGEPGKPQEIVMRISTEKMGDVVLLRVDRTD
jgi:hypothetical protein